MKIVVASKFPGAASVADLSFLSVKGRGQGQRDGSEVESSTALAENSSSVLSTHGGAQPAAIPAPGIRCLF